MPTSREPGWWRDVGGADAGECRDGQHGRSGLTIVVCARSRPPAQPRQERTSTRSAKQHAWRAGESDAVGTPAPVVRGRRTLAPHYHLTGNRPSGCRSGAPVAFVLRPSSFVLPFVLKNGTEARPADLARSRAREECAVHSARQFCHRADDLATMRALQGGCMLRHSSRLASVHGRRLVARPRARPDARPLRCRSTAPGTAATTRARGACLARPTEFDTKNRWLIDRGDGGPR